MRGRSQFLFVFFLFSFFLRSPLIAQEGKDDKSLLVDMLEGYRELFSEKFDDDVEDVPAKIWFLMEQTISHGNLKFTVDPEMQSLLNGARFLPNFSGPVSYVAFTQPFLEKWALSPAFNYAVLTRVFAEASRFYIFGVSGWQDFQNNPFNRFSLRMEAYNAEALLIRDRLLVDGYLLSPYESYVLDSFEKDALLSVALYLEKISLLVAHSLEEGQLVFEKGRDAEDLRRLILDLGESLFQRRQDFPADGDDARLYFEAIAVHSWLELSPWTIASIHNGGESDKGLSFTEVLAVEKEYKVLRDRLEAWRIRDMPLIEHVYQETIQGFEAR